MIFLTRSLDRLSSFPVPFSQPPLCTFVRLLLQSHALNELHHFQSEVCQTQQTQGQNETEEMPPSLGSVTVYVWDCSVRWLGLQHTAQRLWLAVNRLFQPLRC